MLKRILGGGRVALAAMPAVLLGALALAVCVPWSEGADPKDKAEAKSDDKAIEVTFLYGSEKEEWIKDVTDAFNKSGAKVGGKAVTVKAIPEGSGECIDDLLSERVKADLVSPASGAVHPSGQRRFQGQDRQGTDRADEEPSPFAGGHRHVEADGRGPRLARQARRLVGRSGDGHGQGRLGVQGQAAVGIVQVRPHAPGISATAA